MRPGRIVLPLTSIVRLPVGTATSPRLPTALTRLPSITMTASSTGGRPVPSMSVPPRMTSAVGFCASLRAGDIQTISKMRSAGFSHFRPTRVPMSNSPKLVFGCFGQSHLLVDGIDETAALELVYQGGVHKTLRLRQRSFVFELVLDHKLNSLHGRTRNLLQGRRIVLPGSFQQFIVGNLAVFPQNTLAVFLVGSITVHATNESAHKPHSGIALLSRKRSHGDHGAVHILEAKIGKFHQLAHPQLCRLRIKRVTQSRDLDRPILQRRKSFRLRAERENRYIFIGLQAKMLQCDPHDLIGCGAKSGDTRPFPLQIQRLVDLGPSHQTKGRDAPGSSNDDDFAPGASVAAMAADAPA